MKKFGGNDAYPISHFMVMTQVALVDNFAIKNDMERTIIKREKYTIVETDSCSLEEIVEFVVKENYLHHQKSLPKNISEEVEELINEEKRLLPTSKFFLVRDKDGLLIGCIRLHRWNHTTNLPITKFGIRVEETFPQDEYPNIWHIGRFAVVSHNMGVNLFKTLMVCAITPIVKNSGSIMLAELDVKLLKSLKKLGIELNEIGTAIHHIGSKVVPAFSTTLGLVSFYMKNHILVD